MVRKTAQQPRPRSRLGRSVTQDVCGKTARQSPQRGRVIRIAAAAPGTSPREAGQEMSRVFADMPAMIARPEARRHRHRRRLVVTQYWGLGFPE